MDVQTVSPAVQNAAFVVAIIMGAIVIVVAARVELKKGSIGWPSAGWILLGGFLIGFSVWNSAKFKIGPEGLEGDFNRLARTVEEVAEVNRSLTEELAGVAQNVEDSKARFLDLTAELSRPQPKRPETIREIRQGVVEQPTLDPDRIRRLGVRLHPDNLLIPLKDPR